MRNPNCSIYIFNNSFFILYSQLKVECNLNFNNYNIVNLVTSLSLFMNLKIKEYLY